MRQGKKLNSKSNKENYNKRNKSNKLRNELIINHYLLKKFVVIIKSQTFLFLEGSRYDT